MSYKFIVPAQNLTLASFLKEALGDIFSAKSIKKAIEKGSCRVNKRVISYASHSLKKGDQIEFVIAKPEEKLLDILYEDPFFFLINKPSGIATDKNSLQPFFDKPFFLVHRLDKHTSGLLIVAKTGEAKLAFEKLFKQKQIIKHYLALCDGVIKDQKGCINTPLEQTVQKQHHAQVVKVAASGSSSATTHWVKLGRGSHATFVDCHIETGKTHQIRVHMAHIGHPILGDPIYLKKPVCPFIPQTLCLHAYYLSFIHPFTGVIVEQYAKAPLSLTRALKELIEHVLLPRY
jgi:23S rRNA pseudouridine1911/1915/1917 synthase